MKLDLVAKGMEVSDQLREYVEHKLRGFDRHLKEVGEGEVNVVVTFTVEQHRSRQRVDIDVYLKTPGGGALHAWEESNDIYKSLEFAIDDIERQLNRLKERRLEQRRQIQRHKVREKGGGDSYSSDGDEAERELYVMEELPVKKPMSLEDASVILESEGRYFLPFINAATGELNVIYRKKNGNYGVIAP